MTNAKFYRNLICAGLGALALGYVPLSHAFYAQASAPAGFTAGAINTYNAAKAGVTASVELGRIAANASLNVGGRAVSIATKIPLAANAARIAAAAIYLHPGVRTAVNVAAWLGAGKFFYDVSKGWLEHQDLPVSDGMQYATSYAGPWYPTFEGACSSRNGVIRAGQPLRCWRSTNPGDPVEYPIVSQSAGASCPKGWYVTSAGCVQTQPMQPVTQERFVDRLVQNPMSPNIVPELPFDLPVDVPYIEPLFVPTGAPVKNPNYDATKPQTGANQPYTQPGVKIEGANDAKNPFQVNVQPSDRPTATPQGSANPQPITPPGTEGDGSTDKPKEDKDERDLCEKNPDILACQKVDTEVEDAEIPKAEKTVRYAPENPFGGGSCPADQYAKIGTQQMKVIDWTQDCMFIRDYVRPIAFAITALIVAGILAGALKP